MTASCDSELHRPDIFPWSSQAEHKSLHVQVESSREAALRGPHSFPLARLLAVFWHLMRTEGGVETNADLQAGDVFMQISSLVSLRLLSRVSCCHIHGDKPFCARLDQLSLTAFKHPMQRHKICEKALPLGLF